MEIKNFIKIYDNVIPLKILSNLIKFTGTRDFKEAAIVGEKNSSQINFNIRRTYVYSLNNLSNFLSDVHWGSFLNNLFQ